MDKDIQIPEGIEFLQLVADRENDIEKETHTQIKTLGQKAPQCLQNLGTVLSLLDRAASCFWGCRGGDHMVEYLAGRVCSSGRAATRLLLFGFYDESLALTRSIGETANLLFLFYQATTSLAEWQSLSKQHRLRQFSPVKVRIRLEEAGLLVPIQETRYAELCEVATHPTPHTKPQSHNPLGIPTAGARYQEAGVLVALNELSAAAAFSLIPLPKLLVHPEERRIELKAAGLALLRSVGGVDITTVKDLFGQGRP